MMPVVDILLATYNGAGYLPEQLASLERQSFRDWRLIFRDDGSTDGTVGLVRDWADTCGRPCIELRDLDRRVGPSESFSRLMAASDAPWFAFCDQDDVWHPEKLATLLAAGQAVEAPDPTVPVLVHCDLEVVDQAMKTLHPSFWRYRHNDAGLRSAAPRDRIRLLMQGTVTGCAAMGNASLRVATLPIPPEARMHDWWMSLVAAWTGRIVAVDTPLVRYRQHGGNTLGLGQNAEFTAMIDRFVFDNRAALERTRTMFDTLGAQADVALARLGPRMSPAEQAFAQRYAQISRGLRHPGARSLFPWSLTHWRRWPLAFYLLLRTIRSSDTAEKSSS